LWLILISAVTNSTTYVEFQKVKDAFVDKVSSVASRIFKFIKTSVLYPFRLLGSKTFTIPGLLYRLPQAIRDKINGSPTWATDLFCTKGYHQFTYHNLSAQEAKTHLVYAAATSAIHKNEMRWMEPYGYTRMDLSGIELGLEKKEGVFFDRSCGLKFSLYEKDDDVIIVFGAVSSHHSQFSIHEWKEANWVGLKMQLAVVGDLIAGSPDLYKQANRAIKSLLAIDVMQDKKVTLCGQSLGGSIASYVSLRQSVKAYALNAVPLGAGLQKKVGEANLRNSEEYLTQISASGDYPSDVPTVFKVLDVVANAFGLRTPGNFGKRLRVPSLYSGIQATHSHILASMVAKADPSFTELCRNMASSDKTVMRKATKDLAIALHHIG
jgi:hypothetical protein